jgi:hypothetical protein
VEVMFNTYKKSYTKVIDRYDRIHIPSYQRGYVWSENEWEDFYNDILNVIKLDFKPHFMGTILLKSKGEAFEIIDGQQRLITLSIFLMAFRDVYSALTFAYTNTILTKRIMVNDEDNIYEAIFRRTYIKGQRTLNNSESKNIENAYQFFKKKFESKKIFGQVTTDFNLSRVFHKLFFVAIEIDNNTNPYLIFETLNARGIDLNISDLVKNYLLDLAKTDSELSKFIDLEWNQFMHGLCPDQFENIFQSYYKSSNNRKKLLKEITGNVANKEDTEVFLRNLGSYVFWYKKLSDISNITWEGDSRWVNNVRAIKSYKNSHLFKVVTIPLLSTFPRKLRIGAFNFIESLIFRYVVICQKDKNKLLEKCHHVAKQINDKTITTIEKLKIELSEFIIDDEEFKYSFAYRSIEYSRENPDQIVRYILYKLENQITNSSHIIGVSDASVEHIEPNSSNRYNLVYRLGNYTLLSKQDNEDASNKDFATKREEYYVNNQFGLTYNAVSAEVKSLYSYTNWNLANIQTRQMQMAEIALKVWKV